MQLRRKERQHPCWNWCSGRLQGIVDNVNLTQGADMEIVSIKSARRAVDRDDKRGIITFDCPHQRMYLLNLKPRGHCGDGSPHGAHEWFDQPPALRHECFGTADDGELLTRDPASF